MCYLDFIPLGFICMSLCLLYKWWQATNEVVTRVPESTRDEMEAAVASCKRAFNDWSQTTILTRQQMMFKLQNLIRENLVTATNVILRYIWLFFIIKMCWSPIIHWYLNLKVILLVIFKFPGNCIYNVPLFECFSKILKGFNKPLNNSKSVYTLWLW